MKQKKLHGKEIIHTIQEAEPIGPKHMTDIMIIVPATGNTMAKLANDIIDGTATMAVKSHLRKEKPIVIAVSTDSGLSSGGQNIGKLLNMLPADFFIACPLYLKIKMNCFHKIQYVAEIILKDIKYI